MIMRNDCYDSPELVSAMTSLRLSKMHRLQEGPDARLRVSTVVAVGGLAPKSLT